MLNVIIVMCFNDMIIIIIKYCNVRLFWVGDKFYSLWYLIVICGEYYNYGLCFVWLVFFGYIFYVLFVSVLIFFMFKIDIYC